MLVPFLLQVALASPAVPLPRCGATLDSLRRRVEANYAGYRLEVTGTRRVEYDRLTAGLARAAEGVSADTTCLALLRRYTDWFDDPHLGVIERDRHDSTETRRRMAEVAFHPVREEEVLAALARRGERADPIEGIWYDRGMRLAVIPDPAATGEFLVDVTRSDTLTLPDGAVRGRFRREGAGRYAAELRSRDLSLTHVPAFIARRTLLRLYPGIWGKAAPLAPADTGLLDPTDPRRPTYAVRAGVPVFTVPSHDGPYKAVVDSLVRAHRRELERAEFLLIDLRGNEGGGAFTTAALFPYMVGPGLAPARHPYRESVMLSSPDQIAYAGRAFGSPTSEFVQRLVAALRAAPGELVPLYPDPAAAPADPVPEPAPGPSRVGVLVDRGTVSAAEVMADFATRTARAVLIGEPTAGALDYQSTSLVRAAADDPRWLLIYPTITAHPGLPVDGIRGRGILPELPLQWDTVADPIGRSLELLRERRP